MKKSVVFVEVTGVMGVYDSVGRGCVSFWFLRMYSRHRVLFLQVWSSISFLPPVVRISVRTVFSHVRVFFSGSWSSKLSKFIFSRINGHLSSFCFCPMRIWFCRWGGPIVVVVCIRWCLQRCVLFFLAPLGSPLLRLGVRPYGL